MGRVKSIDYRTLLKKYMAHIIEEEGVSYVEYVPWTVLGIDESDKAELRRIEIEIRQEILARG